MPNITPGYEHYIKKITLPDGITYYIKDEEARAWIEQIIDAGVSFVIGWDGASTPDVTKIPKDVVVTYQGTSYTGTLEAAETTKSNIYLIWYDTKATPPKDAYEEYITVDHGAGATPRYGWELLGNTDINLDQLGDLAYYDSVVLTTNSASALTSVGVTAQPSSVTFTGGSNDTFVKSYPGVTNKLETTTITGTGNNVTFNAVNTNTSVTATNTVFGTDVLASRIVTESKPVTKVVFGSDTSASKLTDTTSVTVAETDTALSNILQANTTNIVNSAAIGTGTDSETLIIGQVTATKKTITPAKTKTINQYTFSDVTVPVVTSVTDVNVASVKTNTDVTVPVVTSNTEVTATNTTITSKTAATKAASATTVATGSLNSSDTTGATIMTGLGTATTASAITNIGSGSAAAQQITVTPTSSTFLTDASISYS